MKWPTLCLLMLLAMGGGACSGLQAAGDQDAEWKTFRSRESRFVFLYPPDWQVIDEGFYKTNYGITMYRLGKEEDSNDWIRINSPQFMEEDGRCASISDQQICTYSSDPQILAIFDRVTESFHLLPPHP